MGRINSRAKGSSFERAVAKLLIAAYEDKGIEAKDCFRTPGSGGHMQASKTDPGDLVLSPRLRRLFSFSIECKHYKRLEWHRLTRTPVQGTFKTWWDQTTKAASRQTVGTKKPVAPMLIFKENGGPVYVMTTRSMVTGRPDLFIATVVSGKRVVVMLLSDFFKIYKQENG